MLNRIHAHESVQMIEALGFDDAQSLKEASDSLAIPHHRAVRRGEVVVERWCLFRDR